ncbi:TrkH family potassium uptake protein [Eubacteriales bacterium KG127]
MIKKLGLSSIQILTIGFALIILVGGILLSCPLTTVNGQGLPFIDGLFTATSATCVTGLSLFDTATVYNSVGQFIIMFLIQTGALGFMALIASFIMMRGRKLSLYSRSLILETLGASNYGRLNSVFFTMLGGTFLVEAIGAALIATRISGTVSLPKAIWIGIFHSVSAFCNAGFDIMGTIPGGTPGTSLVPFNGDFVILITIMLLIVTGGIGFIVWYDIVNFKLDFRKYSLHSKVMLFFTAMLIIISAIFFLVVERNASFANMTPAEKVLNAFFASITPRTAGFASTPTSDLSPAGQGLTLILMIIGAGPCSTGGGIKVTTFLVLMLSIRSQVKNYKDLEIFRRRLPEPVIARALSFTAAYIGLTLLATLAILTIDLDLTLEEAFFECVSAIGTVGLSLGTTAKLNFFSKLIIIGLMYTGRLGSLSVAMAIVRRKFIPAIRYPSEPIVV